MFRRRPPGSHHSSKKPIRPRVVTLNSEDRDSSDDDNSGDGDSSEKMDVEPIPSAPVPQAPPGPGPAPPPQSNGNGPKSTKSNTLSFNLFEEDGDDGDACEVFKVKKSSVSRRLMREKKSKEKMESKSMKKKPNPKEIIDIDTSNPDPTFLRLLTGREAEAIDMESSASASGASDDVKQPQISFQKVTAHHRDRKLASSSLDSLRQSIQKLNSNQIPDANLIHEVRKRRQAMARGGGVPEFIPIESGASGTSSSSRLHRQYSDDEDDSGAEEPPRIELSNVKDSMTRKKKREDIEIALEEEQEGDPDSSGEEDLWEQQQLRKVLQQDSSPALAAPVVPAAPDATKMPPGGPQELIPPSLILSNLKTTLFNLKAIRDSHKSQLSTITSDLQLHSAEVREVESNKGQLNSKFQLYQDLKYWFSDYLSCWNEKLPVVLGQRTILLHHYKTRGTNLAQRHRQDIQDELNQVNGNPIDEKTSRRVAEREARRRGRRRLKTSSKSTGAGDGDGWSTDDQFDQETDSIKYKITRDSVIQGASDSLSDVKYEFYSVDTLLAKFRNWKAIDPFSYSESWGNLMLVKLLGPIVQWKLLEWDPVGVDFNFLKSDWLKSLVSYSAFPAPIEILKTDPDIRLVPNTLEKFLIPWIEACVTAQFSPLSTSQSLRISNLLQKLILDWSVDPKSKAMNTLMLGVINKFKDDVENDVFIPLFGSNKGPSATFFNRQFNSALKLLRNISSFSPILSPKPLQTLALDALLTRYILMALRTGAGTTNLSETLERVKSIVQVLPREWLNPTPTADNQNQHQEIPNGITQLVRSIVGIIKIHTTQQQQNEISKSIILEFCSILRTIGGEVEGDIILAQFS